MTTDTRVNGSAHAMKSMKLYDQVERIHNELRNLGIDEESPLAVEDLTPFDQYHYHGTEAVDAAIEALGLGPDSRVLEVGAGIGGPARYLAETAGCHVTALELQADLNATGQALTERCSLRDKVRHVQGDMLDGPFDGAEFDALASFLVFLHIPDRARLFQVCRAALKPGGALFIEDFTKLREPSQDQWADLRAKVLCSYLPEPADYPAQLAAAGFADIEVEDMSESWTAFTQERHAAFKARRETNLAIHGPDITDGLEDFFGTVAELYGAGVLGGLRILARRG